MGKVFDYRLRRNIITSQVTDVKIKKTNAKDKKGKYEYEVTEELVQRIDRPFDEDDQDMSLDGLIMSSKYIEQHPLLFGENWKVEKPKSDYHKALEKAKELEEQYKSGTTQITTSSIMNPYAHTRLYGAVGAKFLVDEANKRKYYEEGTDDGHYASNPTTANIIKWGALDEHGRTPYSFQDFVFCKHWNVIANNRLITLRRYARPVLDNLVFDYMESSGEEKVESTMHPIATALTYFGEGTDNKLSDILKFNAHYNWGEAKGDIWEVTGEAPSMERLGKGTGWDKIFSTGFTTMSTVMGILGGNSANGNPHFDFRANQGLPPDPYHNGPYENQILGPINTINKTFKRERGLEFSNEIKISFHYVARPIGHINNKAALLDAFANMLVMAYGSGVWWGGSHRFRIQPTTYPFTASAARQAFWKGKLTGQDGAAKLMVEHYAETMKNGLGSDGKGFGKDIFTVLVGAAGEFLGGILEACGLGNWKDSLNAATQPKDAKASGKAKDIAATFEQMVASSMQKKIGTIQYLNNMKSILTGDPVGDWHLTIGNPMNPIAEIGNLICKGIDFKWDDELGPDDFPIGFTATLSLDHGMPRDRDGIEAMYNKGAGRIYVLPDKYASAADGQTKIDSNTGKKMKGVYAAGPQNPHTPAASTWSTAGYCDNIELSKQKDANQGMSSSDFANLTNSHVPIGFDITQLFTTKSPYGMYHFVMPWQTKIVM